MTFDSEEVRFIFHDLSTEEQMKWFVLEGQIHKAGKTLHILEVLLRDGLPLQMDVRIVG